MTTVTDKDYPNPPKDEQRSDYHRECELMTAGDPTGEVDTDDAPVVYTSVEAFMNDSGDNCLPEDGKEFVSLCKSALIHTDPVTDNGAHCLALVAMALGFQIIQTMKKNGLTYNSIKVK